MFDGEWRIAGGEKNVLFHPEDSPFLSALFLRNGNAIIPTSFQPNPWISPTHSSKFHSCQIYPICWTGKNALFVIACPDKKKKKNVIYRWKSKQETKDRLNKISWWSVGQIDWNVACKNRSSMIQLKYSNNIFFHIILLFYYTI